MQGEIATFEGLDDTYDANEQMYEDGGEGGSGQYYEDGGYSQDDQYSQPEQQQSVVPYEQPAQQDVQVVTPAPVEQRPTCPPGYVLQRRSDGMLQCVKANLSASAATVVNPVNVPTCDPATVVKNQQALVAAVRNQAMAEIAKATQQTQQAMQSLNGERAHGKVVSNQLAQAVVAAKKVQTELAKTAALYTKLRTEYGIVTKWQFDNKKYVQAYDRIFNQGSLTDDEFSRLYPIVMAAAQQRNLAVASAAANQMEASSAKVWILRFGKDFFQMLDALARFGSSTKFSEDNDYALYSTNPPRAGYEMSQRAKNYSAMGLGVGPMTPLFIKVTKRPVATSDGQEPNHMAAVSTLPGPVKQANLYQL